MMAKECPNKPVELAMEANRAFSAESMQVGR
jgi:hypothetical protein